MQIGRQREGGIVETVGREGTWHNLRGMGHHFGNENVFLMTADKGDTEMSQNVPFSNEVNVTFVKLLRGTLPDLPGWDGPEKMGTHFKKGALKDAISSEGGEKTEELSCAFGGGVGEAGDAVIRDCCLCAAGDVWGGGGGCELGWKT